MIESCKALENCFSMLNHVVPFYDVSKLCTVCAAMAGWGDMKSESSWVNLRLCQSDEDDITSLLIQYSSPSSGDFIRRGD